MLMRRTVMDLVVSAKDPEVSVWSGLQRRLVPVFKQPKQPQDNIPGLTYLDVLLQLMPWTWPQISESIKIVKIKLLDMLVLNFL